MDLQDTAGTGAGDGLPVAEIDEEARDRAEAHEEVRRDAAQGTPLDFDRPNLLIAGPSGSGKSSSLRNLDPARTIILSTEQKPLPFRGARRFQMHQHVHNFAEFERLLTRALASDRADVVVIDSWTSLTEMAYRALIRPVERSGDKVMAAWQGYKDALHDILLAAKASPKWCVFIGIDDVVQDENNRLIRTLAVQGSLKGKVEKEFTVVLWTRVVDPSLADEAGNRYYFLTNSDGTCKAKTPMEMFDTMLVPNDIAAVIRRVTDYYTSDT